MNHRFRLIPFIFVSFILIGADSADGVAASDEAKIFAQSCAGCHGTLGKGDGVATPFLYPRPRDFTLGTFRFGGAPAEISQTLRRGIPGTSMPSFSSILSETENQLMTEYVRKLTGVSETPEVHKIPAVPKGIGSVSRGRKAYAKNCAPCHGPKGRGDGPTAHTMVDDAGISIRPRDLTQGPLKGGDLPEDIFRRIVNGVPGTPMPSYAGLYPDQTLWDMVAFVRSIRPRIKKASAGETIRLGQTKQMADHPLATGWKKIPSTTHELQPLWQRPTWPGNITVRATRSDGSVSLLLEWADATVNRGVGRTSDFLDSAAIMIPTTPGATPFLGMGLSDEADSSLVRIWHWRAMTMPPGPKYAYARTHRDANPWEEKPLAQPAIALENPVSKWANANVMAYSASGVGTLTTAPSNEMKTEGKAVWRNGRWHVLLTLSAETGWLADTLKPGTKTHVAFAVWDGAVGDRNGQKSVTQWIALEVE